VFRRSLEHGCQNLKTDSSREPAVPRLRDRLREATSGAILAAAEEVFAARGVQAARVEEIAARAGVAVGTLYNYFADRDALLKALLELRRGELLARLEADAEENRDRAFRDRLEGFVRALLTHCELHRAFMSIMVQGDHGPEHKDLAKPREAMQPIHRLAEALVASGVDEGALRAEHAELLPALLVGMLRGLIVRELGAGPPGALPARAEVVTDVFLRGAAP